MRGCWRLVRARVGARAPNVNNLGRGVHSGPSAGAFPGGAWESACREKVGWPGGLAWLGGGKPAGLLQSAYRSARRGESHTSGQVSKLHVLSHIGET